MILKHGRFHQLAIAVVVSSWLTITVEVHAQSTAEDRAAADALFREARALMTKGSYADACPKLAASQQLDPAVGTLLNLGDCYEHVGRTASAWASFNQAEATARKANDKPRADEAARRANALEPKLSRLRIDVAAENRAPGADVRRDNKSLEVGLWGAAVPVDPGVHTIQAAMPRRRPWAGTVTIDAKPGLTVVQVPPLEPAPPPRRGDRLPDTTGADAPAWSTQRTAGLIVVGAGVVGVAIGAGFGLTTLAKSSDSEAHCTADLQHCDTTGIELQREARTTATASNVAFVVGGAALVGGVVLFVTAPPDVAARRTSLRLEAGPTSAGFSIGREW